MLRDQMLAVKILSLKYCLQTSVISWWKVSEVQHTLVFIGSFLFVFTGGARTFARIFCLAAFFTVVIISFFCFALLFIVALLWCCCFRLFVLHFKRSAKR